MEKRERVIERLDKYMKYKGLSGHKVSLACNLSNGLLSKARAGNNDLSLDTVAKIVRAYPDLNRDWLISGDGSMLRTAAPLASNTNNAPVAGNLTQTATAAADTLAETPSAYSNAGGELAALRVENRILREQNDKLIAALAERR